MSGYILFSDTDEVSVEKGVRFSIQNPTFHLVLGIISTVTGILKLLSPSMDGIPLLGDLIPSAAGVTAGLLLIFGIYRHDISSTSTITTGTLDRLGTNLLRFRKSVGIGLLGVALLHFLFPQALFL